MLIARDNAQSSARVSRTLLTCISGDDTAQQACLFLIVKMIDGSFLAPNLGFIRDH